MKSGRDRWHIENHGFNVQKNHGFNIEHAFSENYNAMKNHYLLAQIAHTLLQLMMYGLSILQELNKSIKNIMYDILEKLRNVPLSKTDLEYICKRSQIRLNLKDTS